MNCSLSIGLLAINLAWLIGLLAIAVAIYLGLAGWPIKRGKLKPKHLN